MPYLLKVKTDVGTADNPHVITRRFLVADRAEAARIVKDRKSRGDLGRYKGHTLTKVKRGE